MCMHAFVHKLQCTHCLSTSMTRCSLGFRYVRLYDISITIFIHFIWSLYCLKGITIIVPTKTLGLNIVVVKEEDSTFVKYRRMAFYNIWLSPLPAPVQSDFTAMLISLVGKLSKIICVLLWDALSCVYYFSIAQSCDTNSVIVWISGSRYTLMVPLFSLYFLYIIFLVLSDVLALFCVPTGYPIALVENVQLLVCIVVVL